MSDAFDELDGDDDCMDEDDRQWPVDDEDDDPGMSPDEIAAALERFKAKVFDPKPFVLKPTKKIIGVIDTETDPFAKGVIVAPFCLGFYYLDPQTSQLEYEQFWGDDCVIQFFDWLGEKTKEGYEFIIYAHNGGKFDFFFFLQFLDVDQTPLIMTGRLVKINFAGQEFRDSYSIIPQRLAAYQKEEIDYSKFVRSRRGQYKDEILSYMKSDCVYAYELITGFHDMFGDKLTIASASLPMLHSVHGFQRFKGEGADDKFRPFYYGGRNQCFETGVLRPRPGKSFLFIDRNSMYPAEMRDSLHPISSTFRLQREIDTDTDFAYIEADNFGALPMRAEDGGLDFTVKRGKFHATIHEIRAGLETGTLRIRRVLHAYAFDRKASFSDFVNRFYDLRLLAKAEGDKVRDILYKFVLNSGYGKFALNPRKFKQWTFTVGEIPKPIRSVLDPEGWELYSTSGDIMIWCRPNPRKGGFYNIATAASITGAARANLLRTISICQRPIYCDTDSVLCEGYKGTYGDKLGDWKLEAEGNRAAIAGKKLYAVFNDGDTIKQASKGVNLTAQEIIDVCNGKEVLWQSEVPSFKFGTPLEDSIFLERRVNMTGVV